MQGGDGRISARPHRFGRCPQSSLKQLFKFIGHKLDLGADNDLNARLARTHNARGAGSLNLLIVDKFIIFDLKAQAGDAVIDGGNVVLTAEAFKNARRNGGKIGVGNGNFLFRFDIVVILTAGRFEVEFGRDSTAIVCKILLSRAQ